ncbi:TIGR04283 family arsenosugar biosynthesis glycosyltransferase [Shimia sp.]|uniref:TIGR04283 family arsenosugar biosynthesis glycosyltransferase n=1 Tax=Shimia sp. TaxID=1954381 RepID=UPI003299B672
MRAPISVIIPTLNAEQAFPGCLAALFEGVQAGIIRELIVADGGSQDATCKLADDAGATILKTNASRGGQLRTGAAAARGDWMLFVHADTCLAPGWTEAVTAHLSGPEKAGYFQLKFDATGFAPRVVAGWANLRSRVFGLPYGDQGLLISKDMYDHAGGYPDVPLMEDVALARSLSGQLSRLDGVAQTSADKYRKAGWLRRGARNIWTLLRYLAGVSPERLAAAYRR